MSFVDGQSSINLVRLKFRKHQQKGPISLPLATTVFSISRRTGQQKWRQLRALERENRQLREWVGKFVNGVTGVTGCRVRSICLLREKVWKLQGGISLIMVPLFVLVVFFFGDPWIAPNLNSGGRVKKKHLQEKHLQLQCTEGDVRSNGAQGCTGSWCGAWREMITFSLTQLWDTWCTA